MQRFLIVLGALFGLALNAAPARAGDGLRIDHSFAGHTEHSTVIGLSEVSGGVTVSYESIDSGKSSKMTREYGRDVLEDLRRAWAAPRLDDLRALQDDSPCIVTSEQWTLTPAQGPALKICRNKKAIARLSALTLAIMTMLK